MTDFTEQELELAQWLCLTWCKAQNEDIAMDTDEDIWNNNMTENEQNTWLLTARELQKKTPLFFVQSECLKEVACRVDNLPYSWNVVIHEVMHKTMLGESMLKEILKSHFLKEDGGNE